MNQPNILFLTESREDYLADSLLHGLISLGCHITDYPRKDILYSASEMSNNPSPTIRGHGFTLYGLLEDRDIDRTLVIQKLQAGFYELVIVGQIWRQWGQFLDIARHVRNTKVVLLDGDDDPRIFHHSLSRIRLYGLQPMPIPTDSLYYFKRELLRYSSYPYIFPISFSIPDTKILHSDTPKSRTFATHCVDEEVSSILKLKSNYAFADEPSYYYNLHTSKYAITTKRGGWDCLRHYEIAAAGALMCFKNLLSKPQSCAPHGLVPNLNCISYRNYTDLQAQIDSIEANPYRYHELVQNQNHWILSKTTSAVALSLLNTVGFS